MVGYKYLRRRIDRIVVDMEKEAILLVDAVERSTDVDGDATDAGARK